MLTGGSPREKLFADKTLAHALTDENEHLADPVGVDGARASLRFFVSSHVGSSPEPLDPSLQYKLQWGACNRCSFLSSVGTRLLLNSHASSQPESATFHCGGLGHVFGLVPSDRADRSAQFLRNREFPRSIVGSATLAPQQGVPERFPNLVEGNGVRGHPVSALLGELTQRRRRAPSPSLGGLRERKGDP